LKVQGMGWKGIAAGILCSVLLLGMHTPIGQAGPRVERMTIMGGPPGGVFGIFATGIATHVNRVVPEVDISMRAGGGVENVRRVHARDAEMGIAFAVDIHEGYHGQGGFAGDPQPAVRGFGLVFTGTAHLVTFKRAGIRTVEDLVGRRVAVGSPGTGTFALAERLFGHLGIWDRITRVPLLGGAAAAALVEGRVDAFFFNGPFPDRGTIEAALHEELHLIDLFTPAERTGFLRLFPFHGRFVYPAGSYRGVTAPVATLSTPVFWFGHRDLPASLVQRMVAAVYSRDGHAHMLRVHAAARDMTVRLAIHGLTIPLHAGAEAHWRAAGLEIPEAVRSR
jgi:TRAP transporter TAXI family solute receptor